MRNVSLRRMRASSAGKLLGWSCLLAAAIVGCDDQAGTAGVTRITVDGAACLGGADQAAAGSCRAQLDSLVSTGAVNGCLVAARDGGGKTQYVPLRWADGRLKATEDEPVDLSPGQTIEAALFLFADGFSPSRCAAGGLTPETSCLDETGCVLKLVQRATALAEGVTLDFRNSQGVCAVQTGLLGETELCDGLDNDCDGVADETFPTKGAACSAGAGACMRTGEQVCNETGDGLRCTAEATGGGQEICDGLDNDCDGNIDNGLTIEECCVLGMPPIGCGQPVANSACLAGTRVCEPIPGVDGPKGTLGACVDAQGQPVVLAGQRPETCDTIDNDCDGKTDEDLVLADADQTQPGDQAAPVGAVCRTLEGGCAAEGDVACRDGQPICDHPPIVRGDEVCDRADNDCDGQVDETFAGQGLNDPCNAGVGACRVDGRRVCAADQMSVVCGAQAGQPAAVDACGNGLDDDCDGRTDEGHPNLGMPCTVGDGACRVNGEFVCTGDGQGTECGARPRNPSNEACNGIDDDCDGQVDEDFDVTTDPDNCGRCGRACDLDNAVPECRGGNCFVDVCLEGFQNADDRDDNGCECNPNEADLPDPTFTDSNCDGVDGVAQRALFVSAEAGNDATGTGEPTAPFRSIARAVAVARTLAELNNFRDIYLDVGRYSVTQNNADPEAAVMGILVPPGVSIYGGFRYDAGGPGGADDVWGRGARQDFSSVITGSQIVLRYVGTAAGGLGRITRLDNLVVETSAGMAQAPLPTVGVVAVDTGDHLVLRDVEIIAHDGAAGPDGTAGEDGLATAGPGAPGVDGAQPAGPGEGGSGGTNNGCSNVIGGRGGAGGRPGMGAQSGFISVDAARNALSGLGGVPGMNNGLGQDGGPGEHGGNAAAGGAAGRVDGTGHFWIARPAGNAGTGQPGGPGGGGAGGANSGAQIGGGGGGGGAGGCAGSGGRGAEGGAGSFALQVLGGTVHLQGVTLHAGRGGAGGDGGPGGAGAPGGLPGLPGLGAGGAVNGGFGGEGGPGGCGGHAGGGSGGPSFAVLRISPSPVAADISRSVVVFEDYNGRAVADQAGEIRARLSADGPGAAGAGGERDGCGRPAQGGLDGVTERVGCCANGRGTNNCNALRCE